MPPKPMEIYRRLLKEGWVEKSRKGLHCKLVRGASIIIFLFIEKSVFLMLLNKMQRQHNTLPLYESIRRQAGWK